MILLELLESLFFGFACLGCDTLLLLLDLISEVHLYNHAKHEALHVFLRRYLILPLNLLLFFMHLLLESSSFLFTLLFKLFLVNGLEQPFLLLIHAPLLLI